MKEFMLTIDKIVDLVGYAANIVTSDENVEEYLIEAMNRGDILDAPDLAVIDYNICKNCGECVSVCPTGCLKKVFFPDIPENCDYTMLVD